MNGMSFSHRAMHSFCPITIWYTPSSIFLGMFHLETVEWFPRLSLDNRMMWETTICSIYFSNHWSSLSRLPLVQLCNDVICFSAKTDFKLTSSCMPVSSISQMVFGFPCRQCSVTKLLSTMKYFANFSISMHWCLIVAVYFGFRKVIRWWCLHVPFYHLAVGFPSLNCLLCFAAKFPT